jgi:EAL domain-containing protein (putative c-di-GMP-specific phosphodiesterase class I)/GGDEF domain-containing protein
LADTSPIPLIVLSRQQDPVEVINSTLRNAGHPVHCAWIRDLADLGDALAQQSPRLIFLVLSDPAETAAALELRRRFATRVPTLLVRESLTEQDLVRGLELGAQDVVTLAAGGRLQSVATRELQSSRLDEALSGTLASALQYRDQMKAFMTGSTDAIAHVQEGIVVDVNPAWMELFGHKDPNALLGQPLMDHFDASSHTALKGALVAAAQGRWSDHSISTTAVQPGGARLDLELELEKFEFEGESAVRLRVAPQKRDFDSLKRQLDDALRHDTTTGLLKRSVFLEQATARAAHTLRGGLRAIAYLEPDKLSALKAEFGPLPAEDLMVSIGTTVRALLQPGDLAGRVSAHGIAVLFERGNTRDLEAWLGLLLQRVAATAVNAGGTSLKTTCSMGVVTLLASGEPFAKPLSTAIDAHRDAVKAGGNRVTRREPAPARPEIAEADRTWATQIKSALMANRFRLVQQPIASLVGEEHEMFDLVVRMLDEAGQEVLPSEFLAAAERIDLMKNIDRWVVGAAMSFCASRKPHRVFVRLSRDSIQDQTLGAWLHQQIKASGIEAGKVVIELSEDLAIKHIKEARQLQKLLKLLGIELAIEHFGSGSGDPAALLGRLPINYVKIDGALMQGLANDRPLQDKVKVLVDLAKEHHVTTIAERVEDANTMAVLWQLGVEFIQGYFVNNPEQVTLG